MGEVGRKPEGFNGPRLVRGGSVFATCFPFPPKSLTVLRPEKKTEKADIPALQPLPEDPARQSSRASSRAPAISIFGWALGLFLRNCIGHFVRHLGSFGLGNIIGILIV